MRHRGSNLLLGAVMLLPMEGPVLADATIKRASVATGGQEGDGASLMSRHLFGSGRFCCSSC